MTTLTNGLKGLLRRLQFHDKDSTAVPRVLLENVKAVVFFRNVTSGRFKECSQPGVFLKRDSNGSWSNPVAIHFVEGQVAAPHAYGEFDLLLLVLDDEVAKVLERVGQCGFGRSGYRMRNGVLETHPGFNRTAFDNSVQNDPEFLPSTFAYQVGKVFHPAVLAGAILQFRPSSNYKFYGSRNANLNNVLAGKQLRLTQKSAALADRAKTVLGQLFGPTRAAGSDDEQAKDPSGSISSIESGQSNDTPLTWSSGGSWSSQDPVNDTNAPEARPFAPSRSPGEASPAAKGSWNPKRAAPMAHAPTHLPQPEEPAPPMIRATSFEFGV